MRHCGTQSSERVVVVDDDTLSTALSILVQQCCAAVVRASTESTNVQAQSHTSSTRATVTLPPNLSTPLCPEACRGDIAMHIMQCNNKVTVAMNSVLRVLGSHVASLFCSQCRPIEIHGYACLNAVTCMAEWESKRTLLRDVSVLAVAVHLIVDVVLF